MGQELSASHHWEGLPHQRHGQLSSQPIDRDYKIVGTSTGYSINGADTVKPNGAAITDAPFPSLFELVSSFEPGGEGTETETLPYAFDVPSEDEERPPTGLLSWGAYPALHSRSRTSTVWA